MTKAKLRCSKLPLFALCAGSGIPIRNKIIEAEPEFNDPAKLGTAVHEPLALMVLDEYEDPELDRIAGKHKVDIDDLAQLYYYGRKCWPMMQEHFGEQPTTEEYFEREFPTFILSGHPDILGDKKTERRAGADWKSGRAEYAAAWQLFGLRPLCGVELGVIVWLRETWSGEPFEVVEIPPEQEIIEQLTLQVEKLNAGECTTGPHCNSMYCERQHECEAYQEYVRSSVTALVELDESETLPALEIVSRGYNAWKAFKELSKRYEGLLNQVLDEHGEFDSGDGKKVVRTTRKVKSYDAAAARKFMNDLGIVDVDACFKVSGRVFEKAVKALAKDAGEKQGAAWVGALESLEEMGALHYATQNTRREMRT